VQFDNLHFTRDNPDVPSDLEQIPNLLNFLKNKGTLDTNHHAVLISHTAADIRRVTDGHLRRSRRSGGREQFRVVRSN
jgi:hypothetical protein